MSAEVGGDKMNGGGVADVGSTEGYKQGTGVKQHTGRAVRVYRAASASEREQVHRA